MPATGHGPVDAREGLGAETGTEEGARHRHGGVPDGREGRRRGNVGERDTGPRLTGGIRLSVPRGSAKLR